MILTRSNIRQYINNLKVMLSFKHAMLLAVFLLLVHVTEAKNLRFMTQIVLNTTATETDLKTDLLNWIQNLHTIAHFSSIYQISNISIFDNT